MIRLKRFGSTGDVKRKKTGKVIKIEEMHINAKSKRMRGSREETNNFC